MRFCANLAGGGLFDGLRVSQKMMSMGRLGLFSSFMRLFYLRRDGNI